MEIISATLLINSFGPPQLQPILEFEFQGFAIGIARQCFYKMTRWSTRRRSFPIAESP